MAKKHENRALNSPNAWAKRTPAEQSADLAARTARLAVQLSREDAGQYATSAELAHNATALLAAALAARTALEQGKSAKAHYDAARNIATAFGAEVVDRGDVAGMVMGLKLFSGRLTSGFDNLYFVA